MDHARPTSRSKTVVKKALEQAMADDLASLYGPSAGGTAWEALQKQLHSVQESPGVSPVTDRFGASDVLLITYGDQFQCAGEPPLQTLAQALQYMGAGVVSGVHVLPFYPYSSDDGFSVKDYYAVDPALGTWDDVALLRPQFDLMMDMVVNHVSAQSHWFQKFLQQQAPYDQYFITLPQETDVSDVTRPRTHPLLTPVETVSGTQYVWTTFSADQVDVNVQEPAVLLALIDVLLHYVAHGARYVRMDAIGYLWKELGTNCIHRPQTHRIVQLFRRVLNWVAPEVTMITETNVPHSDNIAYFGDGTNEAQLVYNFSLPPLLLHTLHTQHAGVLMQWLAELRTPSEQTTFFNFLASHDGIGVMPARGILPDAALDAMVARVQAHGGQVSCKTNPDGSESPYELNCTWFDALSDPNSDEPEALQIQRFLLSQAIMLAMAGVPGIYVHSLIGSSNDMQGWETSGQKRRLNRKKWEWADIQAMLADPSQRGTQVFEGYKKLVQARRTHPAFHPNGGQRVLAHDPLVVAFLRSSLDNKEHVLCIHNVSDRAVTWQCPAMVEEGFEPGMYEELITHQQVAIASGGTIELASYQACWIRAVVS